MNMGVASQFVTLAEYLRMEFPEGTKDELIQGEVVISPTAKPNRARVMKRLVQLLDGLVDANKFEAYSELSFVVDPNEPASMPQPDVFVIAKARFLKAAKEDRYPERSPELAIEVVSPSNTKKKLAEKTALYLANGSLEVWIVNLKRRTVQVCKPDRKSVRYQNDQRVPLPAPLSKRTLQVADIFSVLD